MDQEPTPQSPTSPPNVVYHQVEEAVRPDWVPAHAIWANGQWYVNGVSVDRLGLNPALTRLTAAANRAKHMEEARLREVKAREGLPPGYYRHGGLIRNPREKVAAELDGGYIADGSHLPGYQADRAARLASIKETAATHADTIAEYEAAKLRMEEADGARHRAAHVDTE